MEPNNFLDLSLRDVSGVLCEKLIENMKEGKEYSCAELHGTNKIDDRRVKLTVVLEYETD